MHALIDTADRKRVGGRVVAAAITGDDDRRSLESSARLRIAMQAGKLSDGLVQKLAEYTRLLEPATR